MNYFKYFAFILLTSGVFTACNLEKEIELDLPVYEVQPIVECYLEPGQPFQLLLTRSSAYFDPFQADSTFLRQLLLDDAEVRILSNGKEYRLENGLSFNPFTRKIFNYSSADLVPGDFENDFELKILLADGKTIEATTRILQPVPIDSIVVQFEGEAAADTLARILTYLTDDPNIDNFYRRQFHHNSLTDSIPNQDFIATDKFVDKNVLAFGTGFSFPVGDTVYNTIYHISHDYFDFLESVFNANASNGNPFGQPSAIVSNVTGTANAEGIFTGLSYVREMTIIQK